MKKVLLIIVLILTTTLAWGAAGDITKAEVRKDVTQWKLDTVQFMVFTKTCKVTYRKVDSNGDSVGEEVTISFIGSEFTDLISEINGNSNINTTIKNAVKTKLGL